MKNLPLDLLLNFSRTTSLRNRRHSTTRYPDRPPNDLEDKATAQRKTERSCNPKLVFAGTATWCGHSPSIAASGSSRFLIIQPLDLHEQTEPASQCSPR